MQKKLLNDDISGTEVVVVVFWSSSKGKMPGHVKSGGSKEPDPGRDSISPFLPAGPFFALKLIIWWFKKWIFIP